MQILVHLYSSQLEQSIDPGLLLRNVTDHMESSPKGNTKLGLGFWHMKVVFVCLFSAQKNNYMTGIH